MTPSKYVQSYHSLEVDDSRMGLHFTANIWMYVSGWNSYTNAEYTHLMQAIAGLMKIKTKVPDIFYIENHPMFDPTEPFYKGSARRAFAGRGSPADIRDAARLAYAALNCNGMTPQAYTEGWFGQDCNAFAGNYQGISPSHSIRAYARGYDDPTDIKGASSDVYVTAPLLPLPVVTSISQIKAGTIIITYEKGGSRPFRHIAIIDTFHNMGAGKALIGVAEWGEKGKSWAVHAKPVEVVDLVEGVTSSGMPGKKLIGWYEKSGKHLRFLLNADSLGSFASRGWHVGDTEGV